MRNVDRFRGRPCQGGLDLASVADLTSWVLTFPCLEQPRAVDVVHLSFVPAPQVDPRRNPKRWRLYREWADRGFLIVTDHESVDYSIIRARVLEDAARFDLRSVAVDRLFQGQQLANELSSEGITVVPFGQGFMSMGPAVATFERRFLAREIHHGGDPVLRWAVSNAVTITDGAGNRKIEKQKSADRVDPLVALVMALDRYERQPPQVPVGSYYERHDLLVIGDD